MVTGQLADANGDFACLLFVLLAASARPRVVQLPTEWRSLLLLLLLLSDLVEACLGEHLLASDVTEQLTNHSVR